MNSIHGKYAGFKKKNHEAQVSVLAILEVCRWLERNSSPKRNIAILTDSQTAIEALYSTTTSSRLVGQCRDALNHLGGTFKVTLLWVPGHKNIEGNERAEGLARQGSALGSPSANTVGVLLAAVGGRVYSHYLAAAGLGAATDTYLPTYRFPFIEERSSTQCERDKG